jgi:hypothetical protein
VVPELGARYLLPDNHCHNRATEIPKLIPMTLSDTGTSVTSACDNARLTSVIVVALLLLVGILRYTGDTEQHEWILPSLFPAAAGDERRTCADLHQDWDALATAAGMPRVLRVYNMGWWANCSRAHLFLLDSALLAARLNRSFVCAPRIEDADVLGVSVWASKEDVRAAVARARSVGALTVWETHENGRNHPLYNSSGAHLVVGFDDIGATDGGVYVRYPVWMHYTPFNATSRQRELPKELLQGGGHAEAEAWLARRACGVTYIHHHDSPMRLELLKEANTTAGVVGRLCSPGVASHNMDWPKRGSRLLSKNEILLTSRFAFAVENSATPLYVTEKVWQGLLTGSVPLYWGGDVAAGPEPDLINRARLVTLTDNDLVAASRAAMAQAAMLVENVSARDTFFSEAPLRRGTIEIFAKMQARLLAGFIDAWRSKTRTLIEGECAY